MNYGQKNMYPIHSSAKMTILRGGGGNYACDNEFWTPLDIFKWIIFY